MAAAQEGIVAQWKRFCFAYRKSLFQSLASPEKDPNGLVYERSLPAILEDRQSEKTVQVLTEQWSDLV